MNKRKVLAGVVAVLGAMGATVTHAGAILSPTSVIANSMGELNLTYRDEHLIDQSGLSSTFVSGATDFATYVASAPTHVSPSPANNTGYASPGGRTSGDIDFDLGGNYTISRMVLWNDTDAQGIGSFTLFISNDAGFASATNLGTFLPSTSTPNPVPAQLFDITDGTGQFVRLRVNSTLNNGLGLVNFGELAFDATAAAAPEPATLALLGLGLAGLGFGRRRSRD